MCVCVPSQILAEMFSGRYKLTRDKKGYFVIDRDGVVFRYILNYLRDGHLFPLPTNSFLKFCVLKEAQFFNIKGVCICVYVCLCVCVCIWCVKGYICIWCKRISGA